MGDPVSIGLEALLVAIFLILPGFAATMVQRTVQHATRGVADDLQVSAVTWAAVSLIRGLAINFIVATVFLLWVIDVELSRQVGELKQIAGGIELRTVVLYFVALYALAAVWGGVSGIANRFEILNRLFLRGWIGISPFPNTWTGALGEFFRGIDPGLVPWAIIKSKDQPALVGWAYSGSTRVDKDKPFEVVLRNAFYLDRGRPVPLEAPDGLVHRFTYLHITPEMQVHVFSGPGNWRPTFAPVEPQAETPPPAGFRFLGGSFYCEGASERAAHPGIFIPIDETGRARCSYCNQLFGFGPIDEMLPRGAV